MTSLGRAAVLNDLAVLIAKLESARPIRVAIDGRTASGKTTLANELAECLRDKGREVIRTSIDGFHRPKVERYARGRHSAEGYYYDARDLPAINALLLDPLGPSGDGRYRTASFDLHNDLPIEQDPQFAPDDAILIVDGTFLQRPELRGGWDVAVFIETSEHVSEQRGIDRDTAHLGERKPHVSFMPVDIARPLISISACPRLLLLPTQFSTMTILTSLLSGFVEMAGFLQYREIPDIHGIR
ncbi:uridylate kinase [Rhizobium sp. RCAM05973]|uniref:uridylate kinase n=1 Tax=Rhizobium sp. RCAM05973 TaxID=2994066 RepID=UPI0022EBB89B|nr:uridylate kinase [Rhizobium sp. RCAM05973]